MRAGTKRGRGRPPVSLHGRMTIMTLALPEEILAEIEAMVAHQHTEPPMNRAEMARYLIGEGLRAHQARKDNLAG